MVTFHAHLFCSSECFGEAYLQKLQTEQHSEGIEGLAWMRQTPCANEFLLSCFLNISAIISSAFTPISSWSYVNRSALFSCISLQKPKDKFDLFQKHPEFKLQMQNSFLSQRFTVYFHLATAFSSFVPAT